MLRCFDRGEILLITRETPSGNFSLEREFELRISLSERENESPISSLKRQIILGKNIVIVRLPHSGVFSHFWMKAAIIRCYYRNKKEKEREREKEKKKARESGPIISRQVAGFFRLRTFLGEFERKRPTEFYIVLIAN